MLFTDGPFVTAKQLQIIDGEFTTVAAQEKIVVDASEDSTITHSINSAGSFFTARFQNFSGYLVGIGVNSNHVAAVLNILSTAINRPRALLHQIPVIEPDPTRSSFHRWVKYSCLFDFYQAIFARRQSDRYEKKMLWYKQQTASHWETLRGNGFPLVLNPLVCPGATLEYDSGTWTAANLSQVNGGAQASAISYDVSITYCSLPSYQSFATPYYISASNQNGAESAGSQPATIDVLAGNVIQVSVASLNPPNGTAPTAIGTASGYYAPMPATHYNVYVGLTPTLSVNTGYPNAEIQYLQNASPIPLTQLTYTLAAAPTLSGTRLNAGQPAQYDFSAPNILWRS